MTEKEKQYYNLYLAVSRSSRNKPFTIRKNFDGFEKQEEYIHIQRIGIFLSKFPQIKPEIYFKAPYELYKDQEYFDLSYFTTQKAIKSYTLYMKQKQEESPDTEEHLNFIRNSLRYIAMFCMKEKIPLNQYLLHKSGITYTWMKHVKEHNVCIYALFGLPNLFETINNTPEDEKDLFLNDIATNIYTYKTRLNNSPKAKHLINEGMNKITKITEKYLSSVINLKTVVL